MPTYILGKDGWIDKKTGEPMPRANPDSPPCLPRIDTSDSQEPLLSHADGKLYTSKAAMRASYRAENNPQGVNYVELGPEPYRRPKPTPDKEGIRTAIKQAKELHNL